MSLLVLAISDSTHCGRVAHLSVGNLTIIGSDNGLSPCRFQAIFYTNAGILLIGPIGTNLSEILIEILIFSFKKMSSAKWWAFCLSHNDLTHLALGRYGWMGYDLELIILELISRKNSLSIMNSTRLHFGLVNIDSGNGLWSLSSVLSVSVWPCGTPPKVILSLH